MERSAVRMGLRAIQEANDVKQGISFESGLSVSRRHDVGIASVDRFGYCGFSLRASAGARAD